MRGTLRLYDAGSLEVQGVLAPVLRYLRDDLRQPENGDPGHSACDRDLHEWGEGHSALQLSRDLDCQYKTAFVLSHKIREALAAGDLDATASGEVEIDGCYVGGYVRPANWKEHRRDRRLAANQSGKRRVVIVMRERHGKTLTFVSKTEDASVSTISKRVAPGSTIYADEAAH